MRSGRPPLSDAEKKKRGTFDPRFTAAAREERSAQKVVSLFGADVVSTMPEPPEGLHPAAASEFREWCQRLLELKKLSKVWITKIELLAMARHASLVRIAEGKLPRGGDLAVIKSILSDLGALNVDKPASPSAESDNRFAFTGFANRKRPA